MHHVMYVCETWPFILGKEHSLRVFENRVPMKIFQPKKKRVKGE